MSIRSLLRTSAALLAGASSLLALTACGGTDSSRSALQTVRNKGEIVIGTEGTYAPFSYHDSSSNELVGYDVEVATAIAKELGVKARFEEANFDSLLAGIDAGKVDTVANQIGVTDERRQKYDFSDPYTYSYGVIVAPKDKSTSYRSFADIAGLKAAESMTSNWNRTAQDNGAEIVQVNDFSQAVEALRSGRADVTVNDGLAALDYLKHKPDADIAIAFKSEKTAAAHLPFRKGSDDLSEAVDKAISTLRDNGTLARISDKYFGEDVSSK